MDTFWLLASGGSTVEEFAKDVYLKSNLKSRIDVCIKQLLQDVYGQDDDHHGCLEKGDVKIITEVSSPAVNSLVNCFEACFLHGLKGKPLFNRVRSSSSSSSSNRDNEYRSDFWSVILILSHNQVSESLAQLNNIKTDIGRCRAWLRLTMNDGLLRSYLEALINDTSLLHGFYRPSAYLRDKEHMDSLRKMMEPLKMSTFQLNYDHYLLNSWNCDTLKLIGISLQDTSPIVTAVDALSTLSGAAGGGDKRRKKDLSRKRTLKQSDNGRVDRPSSQALKFNDNDDGCADAGGGGRAVGEASSSSGNSYKIKNTQAKDETNVKPINLATPKLEDDKDLKENAKIEDYVQDPSINECISKLTSTVIEDERNIFRQEVEKARHQHKQLLHHKHNPPRERDELPCSLNLDRDDTSSSVLMPNSDSISCGGNSINNKGGWSTSPPEEEPYENLLYSISTNAMLSSTPDIKEFIFIPPSNDDGRSVVSNGSAPGGGSRRNSSSKGISLFKRKKSFSNANLNNNSEAGSSAAAPINNDFEIIPKTMVLNSQESETQEFLLHLTKIANHVGLDEQDYKCYSCGRPIGMIYGKFRVCEFDGFNYCTECHTDEKWLIPARIVNNWDFKKYSVANRNKKRLQLIESEPLIDIKVSAPLLYQVVKELQEILDLRTQLFYLHAYLFTCKEQVALGLRRILWPRDHLYEHIHLYSSADLVQAQSGTSLGNTLRKAIQFARKHVLSCVLCSQKGFICEICKSPQIIYPFDTDITYRCDNCKAVFHITCFITETGKRPCPRCLRIKRRERAAVSV